MTKDPVPYQEEEFGDEPYEAEIDDNQSVVASSNTSKIFGFVILGLFIAVIAYFMIPSGELEEEEVKSTEQQIYKDPPKDADEKPEIVKAASAPIEEFEPIVENITSQEDNVAVPAQLEIPELPEIEDIEIASDDDFGIIPDFGDDTQDQKTPNDLDKGIKDLEDPGSMDSTPKDGEGGGMMLLNGGSESYSGENNNIPVSSATSVEATKIAFPKRTIAQGKIINSILETAINSDFEGKVRAIVSRDIYADFGRNILVPKGSRLIGSYSKVGAKTQTRILITWERLIRPDAVDIQINSPATDQFGRTGVPGMVDNKYLELFNNSILLSMLTIGTAFAVEEATNSSGVSTTENTSGSTTTAGAPSDFAAQEVIKSITDTAQTILTGLLDVNPTITVPHGTRIKVFVNQDLVFPKSNNSNIQTQFLK